MPLSGVWRESRVNAQESERRGQNLRLLFLIVLVKHDVNVLTGELIQITSYAVGILAKFQTKPELVKLAISLAQASLNIDAERVPCSSPG